MLRYKQRFYIRFVVYIFVFYPKTKRATYVFILFLCICVLSSSWIPLPLHCTALCYSSSFVSSSFTLTDYCSLFIPFSSLMVHIAFRSGAFIFSLPPPPMVPTLLFLCIGANSPLTFISIKSKRAFKPSFVIPLYRPGSRK